jgi:hypothetical protein
MSIQGFGDEVTKADMSRPVSKLKPASFALLAHAKAATATALLELGWTEIEIVVAKQSKPPCTPNQKLSNRTDAEREG